MLYFTAYVPSRLAYIAFVRFDDGRVLLHWIAERFGAPEAVARLCRMATDRGRKLPSEAPDIADLSFSARADAEEVVRELVA